jgi:putative protease
MRQDLNSIHGFENFSGSREEAFRLSSVQAGSNVYPWEPFSIVDKIPFLKEAGFSRFILDFSPGPLKKPEYRDIMEAVKLYHPIPGASRFNWKDGFFNEK